MTEAVIDQTTTDQTVPPSDTETKVPEKPSVADTQETVAETDEQKNERVRREAEEKAAKRARGVQRRIDELTAEKHAERKRADELLELVKTLSGKSGATQTQAEGEPAQRDGEPWEDFAVRRAEWRAERKVEAKLAEFQRTQQEQTRTASSQQNEAAVEREYLARQKEAAKTIPDFMETMEEADVEVPTPVFHMLKRLPEGPLIAYHMAKNSELARQFYENPPEMHPVLLGRLAATLKAPQKSNAPAPGKPVQSRPGTSSEPPSDPEKYWAWAEKNMR